MNPDQYHVAALLLAEQALETNYAEIKTRAGKVQQLEADIQALSGMVTFVPIRIFAPQMCVTRDLGRVSILAY
jgi:hypothetical protein